MKTSEFALMIACIKGGRITISITSTDTACLDDIIPGAVKSDFAGASCRLAVRTSGGGIAIASKLYPLGKLENP